MNSRQGDECAEFDGFDASEELALRLDADDPLARYRDLFHLPVGDDGSPLIYFAGNSLGLQPRSVRHLVAQELGDWASMGVEGHFKERQPWYHFHQLFRDHTAQLVGGLPAEVVCMNSLTVNLHLMLTSFYRPQGKRTKILVDTPTFPSDLFAVQSQLRLHGLDPDEALLRWQPRENESTLNAEDYLSLLARHGDEIALVLLNGVNYYTGQVLDIGQITAAAHQHGCLAGWDLAHAVGNVVLQLHDAEADFAVWCNYKYMNAGPGAIGGCFVHEKHGHNPSLPRLAGWWGNDPATRFQMHQHQSFIPLGGADGWQVSNPSIFAMIPLLASLAIFDEAQLPTLRKKSEALTGYLLFLLDQVSTNDIEVVTPRRVEQRGCQLSILIRDRPATLLSALRAAGVICDFRPPNVIRVAPVPLYNQFHEVWRFVRCMEKSLTR